MEEFNSANIKLGILKDLRKRLTLSINERDISIEPVTVSKELRGIVFEFKEEEVSPRNIYQNSDFKDEENDDSKTVIMTSKKVAHDIVYPSLYYPIVEDTGHERIIGVEEYTDFAPLFRYYNLEYFSYQDLQEFLGDVLLSKSWLKNNINLFGWEYVKSGYIEVYEKINKTPILSNELYDMIKKVHELNGINLSKREQKRFKLRP